MCWEGIEAVPREPYHISQIVADLLARTGAARPQATRELESAWRDIVGGALADVSRPVRVFRSRLEVLVAHSTAVQELTFRKSEILQKLNQQWPERRVKDIKFRVGPIK